MINVIFISNKLIKPLYYYSYSLKAPITFFVFQLVFIEKLFSDTKNVVFSI